MIIVRPEEPSDINQVHAINLSAFEGGPEAGLVDALRSNCADFLSLVADDEGRVVGHILFTPVVVEGSAGKVTGMGLAPMAVLPGRQRNGIGSELVRSGLELLREDGCPFVIVLGHPDYYPRFGFDRASRHGLRSQWDGVPDDAFMVMLFDPDILPDGGGIARYRDEFDAAVID
jgi:putative acetyltransferase